MSTFAPGDRSGGYGGLFWLNAGGAMERLFRDASWAAGYMGPRTLIIPPCDLLVMRQGPSSGNDGGYFEELVGRIFDAIGAAPASERR
ncbi:MAG: hypothetical protein KatS3mg081_1400 [Gemmatimonadales bacterium]|nr:MAG: hypothetical protein KatS3mg081_1400 [Gemmatimonadales bacterium]